MLLKVILVLLPIMVDGICYCGEEDLLSIHSETTDEDVQELKYEWNIGEENLTLFPILKISWTMKTDPVDGWMYSVTEMGFDNGLNEWNEKENACELLEEQLNKFNRRNRTKVKTEDEKCMKVLTSSTMHENLTDDQMLILCDRNCINKFCWQISYCYPELNRISKSARSITARLNFDHRYKFQLYEATTFAISEYPASVDINAVSCIETALKTFRVSRTEALEKCKDSTTAGNLIGPVQGLKLSQHWYNLSANSYQGTLVWEEPLDVMGNITEYAICRATDLLGTKLLHERNGSGYYHYDISWDLNESVDWKPVYILPNARNCVKNFYGTAYEITPEQVCDTNRNTSYCDEYATCSNSPTGAPNPPRCSCAKHMRGDGLNRVWGGQGCQQTCLSKYWVKNHICDNIAICEDNNGTTAIKCICPTGFVGDGLSNGRGCTRNYIILLPISILVIAILAASGYCYHYNSRMRRKKNHTNRYVPETTGIEQKRLPVQDFGKNGVFEGLEIDPKNITIKEVIGRGAFGVVNRAILREVCDEKMIERDIAIKIPYDAFPRNEFLNELNLLLSIGAHENIITVVGCCTGERLMCATEYMIYGDLLNFLLKARDLEQWDEREEFRLTIQSVYKIGCQIARGMEHLRKARIIHGDLAARNILVGKDLVVKISDFGLANDVYRYGAIHGRMEKKVPFKWISPERMLCGKVPITWRSDIWSFGILLHEIVTMGDEPFRQIPRQDLCEQLRKGYRMEKPNACSDNLYAIMLLCWEWIPSKRPTFVEIQNLLETNEDQFPLNLLSNELRRNDDLVPTDGVQA